MLVIFILMNLFSISNGSNFKKHATLTEKVITIQTKYHLTHLNVESCPAEVLEVTRLKIKNIVQRV